MKNIVRIFISDMRRIKTNVVAVVMVIGLCILPSLYAWFNILSNWDPYGPDATSNIKVAVASDDTGIDISDFSFQMGETVIEGLKENDTIGWVFTDTTEEAIEGVNSGEYYAALIFPEDFTTDIISFLTDNMQHPEITYYSNQKKNAIAPKITDKAKTAVQQEVNSQFISTLIDSLMTVTDTLIDSEILRENAGSGCVVDLLAEKLEEADGKLAVYENLLESLMGVAKSASGTTAQFEAVYPKMSDSLTSGESALNSLKNVTSVGIGSITDFSKGLSSTFSGISKAIGSIADALETTNGNVSQFSEVLSTANISLDGTLEAIKGMREVISGRLEAIDEIKTGEGYELLNGLVTNDPDAIGEFMSAPVEIQTEKIYPVETYGSAMAPFYTVLALWVGGLILVAIIHVKVEPEPFFQGAKPYQQFFGRYMVFFFISQVQALLTVLGNLYYIEIQCEYPVLFWFAAAVCSFVFSIFMYSLTVAFGNIGEGIAIIVMVIQVAGAGCTFPVETLPEVFQKVYKYLPFTYGMNAMKEAVAGMYQDDYVKDIAALLIYVMISLVIGLLLAVPFRKLGHVIEKSKEDSGVMI